MSMPANDQHDIIGAETLSVIASANQFNEWMYETIKPFLKGDILEIGSGIGNISQYVIRDFESITLSDYNEVYLETMKVKWLKSSRVKGFLSIDLQHPDFYTVYQSEKDKYDCIFLLNVIEHLKNDRQAVANCKYMLRNNGHLILLAPAYQSLYCKLDKELGHYRRYTLNTLSYILVESGMTVLDKKYFNLLGTLGWFVSGKLMGSKQLGKNEMSTFNTLVPLARIADKIVGRKLGLSAISVGKKN